MKFEDLRKNKNLTQIDLAKKLGVKQCTISAWENGKNIPRYRTIKKIASIFNCSVECVLNSFE